jgi:hypothetical protein
MDGRKIGGILVFIAVVGGFIGLKLSRRSDDSKEVRAEAMAMIAQMDLTTTDKKKVLEMADRAHDVAFNEAYSIGGRRTRTKFDEDRYLDAFFKNMVRQTEMYGRNDLKKAILALRSDIDSAPAEEKEGLPPAEAIEATDQGEPHGDKKTAVKLSADELAEIPESELESRLFEAISQRIESDSRELVESVRKLPKGQRMHYVTYVLENEVHNGGFDQFFTNSSGSYARMAVPSLDLIGAKKHAKLMRRAIAAYARQEPDQKVFKVDKTVKKYLETYKDADLGKLNSEFYEMADQLSKLRIKYIREHPDEFVIP